MKKPRTMPAPKGTAAAVYNRMRVRAYHDHPKGPRVVVSIRNAECDFARDEARELADLLIRAADSLETTACERCGFVECSCIGGRFARWKASQ